MTTKTTTSKPRSTYRMARIDSYDLADQPELREGDTVFLAKIRHNDRRADYNAASLTPHTTNMSHEEREHGELGSCNDYDAFAIGRGVVVEVNENTFYDNPDWIRGGLLEPYLSIKVRMNKDSPPTFELCYDECGHHLVPVRIAPGSCA